MNWLTKPGLTFLAIINFVFIHSSFCQNLDEIVRFSNLQFDKGNFELAANEYNRALFFGYQPQDQLCLKIAKCYLNQNNLEQSAIFFDRAFYSSTSDSIKTEAILGKSFSLILGKDFMYALSELINIDSINSDEQSSRLNFLKGIAYFGLNEDSLAESSFKKCLTELSVKNYFAIENEFIRLRKIDKRYNPKTAWFLSLIIPGAGQLYSGEIKDAINSATLLGGLIYLTVSFAAKYSIVEAMFIILPWFQRYYIGGANKAERLTLEKQKIKRNRHYKTILQQIEASSQRNYINIE